MLFLMFFCLWFFTSQWVIPVLCIWQPEVSGHQCRFDTDPIQPTWNWRDCYKWQLLCSRKMPNTHTHPHTHTTAVQCNCCFICSIHQFLVRDHSTKLRTWQAFCAGTPQMDKGLLTTESVAIGERMQLFLAWEVIWKRRVPQAIQRGPYAQASFCTCSADNTGVSTPPSCPSSSHWTVWLDFLMKMWMHTWYVQLVGHD